MRLLLSSALLASLLTLSAQAAELEDLRSRAADARAADRADAVQERSALERCSANRGVDCDKPEGLREWLRQERPVTDAERAAAAGAHRHRENCAKRKTAC